MNIFHESNGKPSSTRFQATAITFALIVLAFWAASAGQWKTVEYFGSALALLAAGLYGLNKAPEAIGAFKAQAQPQLPAPPPT